jgi:hypothetical protein
MNRIGNLVKPRAAPLCLQRSSAPRVRMGKIRRSRVLTVYLNAAGRTDLTAGK